MQKLQFKKDFFGNTLPEEIIDVDWQDVTIPVKIQTRRKRRPTWQVVLFVICLPITGWFIAAGQKKAGIRYENWRKQHHEDVKQLLKLGYTESEITDFYENKRETGELQLR